MTRFTLTAVSALALIGGSALTGAAEAQDRVRWNLASTFPGSLTQLGTLGVRATEQIEAISDGNIRIRFNEPGALVPALEAFDALSAGSIDAVWSTAGYWVGKVPAAPLFSAVPFGPEAAEYMAWLEFGGGRELYEEIFEANNIHPIPCGITAPEASGWFREEITSTEQLEGLKMRFFGLGAKVMERMGVATQLIAGGDIYPALELGSIDATEFSMPAVDLDRGFDQIAKHYYLPGWHQMSTIYELLINLDRWNNLSETQQAQINIACQANMAYGLAEGEALQPAALEEIRGNGVTIHEWSPEILNELESAWDEVVQEEIAADEDFARVWDSLSTWRENYAEWRRIGFVPIDRPEDEDAQ